MLFCWSVSLWSGPAPKSTETEKELKWPKSDSKVTPRVPTQSDSKVTQKWLKNAVRSHFWANFGSLWGRSAGVTFESLLGHLNSFCMSFLNLPTYCAHALSLALAHNACPLVQASNNESAPLKTNDQWVNTLANQNNEMCILGRQGHSWVKCQMGCLGSLLISIRLCGQQQGGNFYQGQSTKLWIPPCTPPPLLRIPTSLLKILTGAF